MIQIKGVVRREDTAVLINSSVEGFKVVATTIRDTGVIFLATGKSLENILFTRIEVNDATGTVLVSEEDKCIHINGSKKFRDIISNDIEGFCEETSLPSFHIENHKNHYFLAPESLSMVFSKTQNNKSGK